MTTSSYFEAVYEVVSRIPPGRVTTYGAVADYLGGRGGARTVGWALNSTRALPRFVPAHRVVNRDGRLTGKRHFGGDNMRDMLRAEGVEVAGDQVADFAARFWDPAREEGGRRPGEGLESI